MLMVASRSIAAQAPRLFAPEVQIQTDDYAEVRPHFRTRLVRAGPAPQDMTLPQPPDYVEEVEFPSGKLHLKAWMAGHREHRGKLPAVLFLHSGFAFGARLTGIWPCPTGKRVLTTNGFSILTIRSAKTAVTEVWLQLS